ncbi:MAG: TSUP family transporter [Spirochaetales bacterium]|nr:TSUP family transporter [Candidatus Physcosoma equi]
MVTIGIGKILILMVLVFLAGFIDSIAGGGGLISLTSYYAVGLPPVYAIGNNKFSSTFGTIFATINYARNKKIVWRIALSSVLFCLVGSFLGAQIALRYADTLLRYVLLVILPVLTVFTLKKKKNRSVNLIKVVGENPLTLEVPASAYILIALLAFLIGLYDGFFGPGAGTFYTLLFSILGLPMIYAAGTTKVLNLTSNIAAFMTFILNGNILYSVGIPCVFASILGNIMGSNLAIKRDTGFIRKVLVLVIALLYIKIVMEFFL